MDACSTSAKYHSSMIKHAGISSTLLEIPCTFKFVYNGKNITELDYLVRSLC
jgi:hypothetical protein